MLTSALHRLISLSPDGMILHPFNHVSNHTTPARPPLNDEYRAPVHSLLVVRVRLRRTAC